MPVTTLFRLIQVSEEDWHMPIESSQYYIILYRVNQVFTFYHFIMIYIADSIIQLYLVNTPLFNTDSVKAQFLTFPQLLYPTYRVKQRYNCSI